MKNYKKIGAFIMVFALMLTCIGYKVVVCKAYSKTVSYSVSPTKLGKVSIKNNNSNNSVTVTYSAYPNSYSDVARVQIYKNSGFTGTVVTSTTFNKSQPHNATFRLPAGATYYAKISSATGNSFSGSFIYKY